MLLITFIHNNTESIIIYYSISTDDYLTIELSIHHAQSHQLFTQGIFTKNISKFHFHSGKS